MELSGNQLMAAPRNAVWEALLDPTILQRCIPGCEEVARVSDEETHVRILVKLGPVRARFTGKMLMSDVDPARHCRLSFEGVGGAAGSAKGFSNVDLSDEADGTRLTYSVAASVGGKLGQIGGRLIDSSAKKMADEFFAGLQLQLDGGATAAQAIDAKNGIGIGPGAADSASAGDSSTDAEVGAGVGAKGEDRVGVTASPAAAARIDVAGDTDAASAVRPTTDPATRSTNVRSSSARIAAAPNASIWPEGRLAPELYRVGWFALGVLTTLLLTHLA